MTQQPDQRGREQAMITVLGAVVFATIVGIGALDGRSGLALFAVYRPAILAGTGRRASAKRRRDDGNPPEPPAPTA